MKKLSSFAPYLVLALALILLAIPPKAKLPFDGQSPSPTATPPAPPLQESFEGAPQIRLFPRLGEFRPEEDEERLLFWRSYRDQLLRVSAVARESNFSANKVFAFRGVNGIDPVGHFSPLAVKPNTAYRLRLNLKADLPEKASAGVGILQFDRFLWREEQYPESLQKQMFLGSEELLRVRRTDGWQAFDLSFTTGPKTGMIHLVLFREGPLSDRQPVLVDNLAISEN